MIPSRSSRLRNVVWNRGSGIQGKCSIQLGAVVSRSNRNFSSIPKQIRPPSTVLEKELSEVTASLSWSQFVDLYKVVKTVRRTPTDRPNTMSSQAKIHKRVSGAVCPWGCVCAGLVRVLVFGGLLGLSTSDTRRHGATMPAPDTSSAGPRREKR